MENHSGSWRLFNGLAWHNGSHWFALVHSSNADNLKFIENKSHKDSVKTLIKLGHKLGQVEINQMVYSRGCW